MNEDIVLHVENLGKRFKIYANPWSRSLEWISFGKRTHHQPFWALQDISFEVRRGEFLGIIGQNGAGKSTLLKILSGVLQPTTGTYQINGKVLSMLELGADFAPYLSGRENVMRTTELLGFPDGYVQERMEQIAEFSELDIFFDRPVRLYSSGMRSRLAFSLFTFLKCDVLILDEVLAVGDIFFRQKCYAHLEKLLERNTTIILVTHSMGVVRQFCDNLIVLDKGRELYHGEVTEGIRLHSHAKHQGVPNLSRPMPEDDIVVKASPAVETMFWPADEVFTPVSCPENDQAQLTRVAICNSTGEARTDFVQGEQASFYCEVHLKQTIGVPIPRIMITNQFNVLIHAKSALHHELSLPQRVNQGDYLRFCRKMTLDLASGEYVFGFVLATIHPNDYALLEEGDPESLRKKIVRLCRLDQVGVFRIMPRPGKWMRTSHGGICDLPGACHIQLVSHVCYM